MALDLAAIVADDMLRPLKTTFQHISDPEGRERAVALEKGTAASGTHEVAIGKG